MRLKPQYQFVIALFGAVVLLFIVTGIVTGARKGDGKAKPSGAPAVPSVQVRSTPQVTREYEVVARGRTQATRSVVVRSETAGVMAAAPVLQGSVVTQGAVLCRLAVDARQATLDQARANLRSAELTQKGSIELKQKGFRSDTQVLQTQAALDAATAQVRAAEIALAQVNIRAPFAGVFDHRDAEVGSYLAPGQPCGTMIELNPLLVVGDVPETDAGKLKVGAQATARLVSGQVLKGKIRYVAHDADPATRTYHLEISVANPGMAVRSGLSAEVHIGAGSGPAGGGGSLRAGNGVADQRSLTSMSALNPIRYVG
jgi:multidrug efflux system membrane fusion protein